MLGFRDGSEVALAAEAADTIALRAVADVMLARRTP